MDVEDFRGRVKQSIALAQQLYGEFNEPVTIDLDFKSNRIAGKGGRDAHGLIVRFNRALIEGPDAEAFAAETIPHEVAHLVQAAKPELKDPPRCRRNGCLVRSAHGSRWKEICRRLGGSSARCHEFKIPAIDGVKKRKTIRRWIYKTTCGNDVMFTTKTHNRVQQLFASGLSVITLNSKKKIHRTDNQAVVCKIIR